jgi:hypothetical protein
MYLDVIKSNIILPIQAIVVFNVALIQLHCRAHIRAFFGNWKNPASVEYLFGIF